MSAQHQENVEENDDLEVALEKGDDTLVDSDAIRHGAMENKEYEDNLTFFNALIKYRKAVFWSCTMSCALIMEGFDHSYITSFFGYTAFQRKYGVKQPDGKYLITSAWESGIVDGVISVEILILLFVGQITYRLGYRWTMIMSLSMIMAFIFIQFFSNHLYVYLIGELLLGIPWGLFQTVTTSYASEVCPVILRGHLTVFVALCWTLGYLIGECVQRGLVNMKGEKSYRIAFALQWIWPIPIGICAFFSPESPWLLIRQGKTEEALVSARRLASDGVSDRDIEDSVAMMIHTNNIEKAEQERIGRESSYIDLFRGTNFRRTEISIIVCCCQNILNPFGAGWSVLFLEQAGMSTDKAFDFTIGGSAICVFAVFCLWFLMQHKVSRRGIFLFGLISSLIVAIIIGVLGFVKRTNGVLYAMAVILLIESFMSFLGVQATIYPIFSEVPSNALRAKTIGLARALSNLVALINAVFTPKMLNSGPGNWNLGPKGDIYYVVWLVIATIWAYFRIPNCAKLTYAEIDILFENKISARKFNSTKVDLEHACLARDVESVIQSNLQQQQEPQQESQQEQQQQEPKN